MSKKRTSPSSGRLSLNNDFKLSQPDSEFVYNGKNYPDWIFNISLACDAKPILRAMLRGEIDPPDTTKVLHNPDVDAMLTRLKSNVVAFSTKPVPIFFDTSSPDYGTNAIGGAFVTDWDPAIWDFAAAKADYARAVNESKEEEGMSAEEKSALPPAQVGRTRFYHS